MMASQMQSDQHEPTSKAAPNVIESSPSTGDDRRRRFRWSYRAAWAVCANTLIAAGLVGALATWGWPGPTAAILSLAFFVVVIAAVVVPGEGLRFLPKMAWRGLYVGTVLTAATGLTVVLGFLGFFLVLLVTGTAPGLRAGLRRGWGFLTDNRPSDVGAVDEPAVLPSRVESDAGPRDRTTWLPEELESLDDVTLCMAWRKSFVELEAAASMVDRLAVIEHRQRCLDELQRRSPHGVAAWLSSGARASGNPLPYLKDDH
jgi:hypothetical protein